MNKKGICAAIKALEAIMDGHQVLPMAAAAAQGDLFVTATGVAGVIRAKVASSRQKKGGSERLAAPPSLRAERNALSKKRLTAATQRSNRCPRALG
jgi:hypothetical protein